MNYDHNNMNKKWKFLTKIKNTIFGKQDSIDLYNKVKGNTPQYHIPSYDGGMWQYYRFIKRI